jgi:hypothetical protein
MGSSTCPARQLSQTQSERFRVRVQLLNVMSKMTEPAQKYPDTTK